MNVERFRRNLPQLDKSKVFLKDGGALTEAIFTAKLPVGEHLTLIETMETKEGQEFWNRYYREYADLALNKFKVGFVLEHATSWKMSLDMATNKLGMTKEKWVELFKLATKQSVDIREEFEAQFRERGDECPPILISFDLGCREGGYKLNIRMTPEEAEEYHYHEIKMAADIPAIDFVDACTIADPNEAIGFTWAAQKLNLPIVISFVIDKKTNRLQTGHTVKEAIEIVDSATSKGPIYYMINCSHPSWFIHFFDSPDEPWVKRIGGLFGNGSTKSHDELDESNTLDYGDHIEYGRLIGEIRRKSKNNVNIFGGCCGTDLRHVEECAKNLIEK